MFLRVIEQITVHKSSHKHALHVLQCDYCTWARYNVGAKTSYSCGILFFFDDSELKKIT